MEYDVVLRVYPTSKGGEYSARVMLHAHDNDTLVGTEQIWETILPALDPREDNDAHQWALYILRNVVNRLDNDVYARTDRASVKLMLDVFKRKEE